MSEMPSQQEAEQKEEVKNNWGKFYRSAVTFLSTILNLRKGLDRSGTIQGIKDDVEFKGHASWILICSIFIACIGLGENNIPVIVGAMLISPLMGPILGIGLGAGINDFELLKKSLTNFGITIVISLVISTFYFWLVPVPEATPELLARKNATFLAIAIAFFGGTAGIIAGSRTFKSNVVPGVAIATALMPPLCTAGYGLAEADWEYFFGAMYLFLINSVFIALPTYLYIKYMGFPLKEFVDPIRERKMRRNILFFLLIIVIPSGIFFYQVLSKSIFERNAKIFIHEVKTDLIGTNTNVVYTEIINNDSVQRIQMGMMGDYMEKEQIEQWKKDLADYNLRYCELEVIQNEDYSKLMSEISEKNRQESEEQFTQDLMHTELRLAELEKKLDGLQEDQQRQKLGKLENELSILFPQLERLSYADVIEMDFENAQDTIPTVFLHWKDDVEVEGEEVSKLTDWLKIQLDEEKLEVINKRIIYSGEE